MGGYSSSLISSPQSFVVSFWCHFSFPKLSAETESPSDITSILSLIKGNYFIKQYTLNRNIF